MNTQSPVERGLALLNQVASLEDRLTSYVRHHAIAELNRIAPGLTAIRFDMESYSNDDGTYGLSVEGIELVVTLADDREIELYVGDPDACFDCDGLFIENAYSSWRHIAATEGWMTIPNDDEEDPEDYAELAERLRPMLEVVRIQDLPRTLELVGLLVQRREDDGGEIALDALPAITPFDAAPAEALLDFIATVPNVEPASEAVPA